VNSDQFDKEIIDRLSETTLFSQLTARELRKIQSEIEIVQFPAGRFLIREGDPGDCFYIVLNGRLRVFVTLPDGTRQVVGEVARNESVGEMAILTGEPRSATVQALRDSELVKLSREGFNKLVKGNPDLLVKISNIIIQRLRETIHSPLQKEHFTEKISSVAVIPVSEGVPMKEFTGKLKKAFSGIGPTQLISRKTIEDIFGEGSAQCDVSDPENANIVEWLNKNETQFQFLIYEADLAYSPWVNRCIRHSDTILFVGIAKSNLLNNDILNRIRLGNDNNVQLNKELVLLYMKHTDEPAFTMKWLDAMQVSEHYHVRWDSAQDFNRLVRRLTGRGIGVVLGGGGARGFAHFGVLRALNEAGIPIDIIGGTSAGSFVAALYAMGLDYKGMLEINKAIFRKPRKLFDITLPMVSFIRSRRFAKVLLDVFGHTQIEDLWIKYFCASSSLTRADLLVHQKGALWAAVKASASLPGIAPPVFSAGEMLVDGGILDNLPVTVMKDISKGGPIIAVDVSGTDELKAELELRPSLSGWRVLRNKLNPFSRKLNIPNIFVILLRTTMLRSINYASLSKAVADFYMHPPIEPFSLLEFKSFEKIMEVGYEFAQKEIEDWKKDNSRLRNLLG
jgi:predicted acylesterase/phospholipase RssA/CRP-like cAMP-binding protein